MADAVVTNNTNGTKTLVFATDAVGTLGGGFEDASGWGIQCTALSGATVTVALSNDGGTTKTTALLIPVGSATGVTSFNATGAWRVDTSGFAAVYITSASGTCTLICKAYRG